MGPLIRQVANECHFQVVALVITGSEAARGTTAHTSNNELLVDLVMRDLVHQVLNHGIKIARVLLMVGLEGQLGLCKGRVRDVIQEMADAWSSEGPGVDGGMMFLRMR